MQGGNQYEQILDCVDDRYVFCWIQSRLRARVRAGGVPMTSSAKVYVIADIGANHDADVDNFRHAILEAQRCGADAIKFQWTSNPQKMAERRGEAAADGYAQVYQRYLAWPAGFHRGLADICREVGIDYMCTTFLPEDVEVVAPYVARFKVASFEALDIPMLAAHAGYGKDLLVSCGMASDEELRHALWKHNWPQAYERDARPGRSATPKMIKVYQQLSVHLLHCVSAYPCQPEDLNLALLLRPPDEDGLSEQFDGFSDHTEPEHTWTGALAVACGAQIVEAHLRLDTTDPANPDYPHAMTPLIFKAYVDHIRFAERCLGQGWDKKQLASEEAMARYRVRS